MRSLINIAAALALFAGVSAAETFNGKLIDASCAAQQQSDNGCAPTSSTTTYALNVSGRVYRLDENGNAKATAALKSHADRMADPNAPQLTEGVRARVKGTLQGGIIKVETIEVE